MFYIIETNYVGPNAEDNADCDTVIISTSPAIKNLSKEICTSGWCGTNSDISVTAHGEFETIEAAQAELKRLFPLTRETDKDENDDTVVEFHQIGEYEQLSRRATEDWLYEAMRYDITEATTDEQMNELEASYEADANSNGCTLADNVIDLMTKMREELRESLQDE